MPDPERKPPRLWLSSLALAFGVLLSLSGHSQLFRNHLEGKVHTEAEAGIGFEERWAGFGIIAGTLAYRSLKRRRYGASKSKWPEGIWAFVTAGCWFVLLGAEARARLEERPVTCSLPMLWVTTAYVVMLLKKVSNAGYERVSGDIGTGHRLKEEDEP